jgi:HK97 family phage portal protein
LAILAKIFGGKAKAAVPAEGQYRPGPYYLNDGAHSGWLSATAGRFWNWWQMGYSLQSYGDGGAMVEACVSAYSQTVAMLPGDHWTSVANGGRERVTTSALARIIRSPNDYQSMSDLLLNLTRRLYTKGEAFAVAIRNNRFEIDELHWMRDGYPNIAEDGSIFYSLYGNEVVERRFNLAYPIPARDVLHVRLHTPRHPLRGQSPIVAAALELEMSGAALSQQVAFYLNQARPSFILETDEKLTTAQAKDLREFWNAQTQGENAGGTPILSWGLKSKPITVGASDTQLADMLKWTDQHVALAFRMPLQILGIGGTPFASTEALMSSWKSTGLGFAINHIEEAIGKLFALRGYPDEYIEFDTNALLRSSFKERIEALSIGTRRLYTINEARAEEGLAAKPGGDELLVQMQDIPLSQAGKTQQPAPALPAPGDDPSGDGAADDTAPVKSHEHIRKFRAAQAAHALAA